MHVQDHCEALFMIYTKGKIGENYNIGSGVNLKKHRYCKKIVKHIKN